MMLLSTLSIEALLFVALAGGAVVIVALAGVGEMMHEAVRAEELRSRVRLRRQRVGRGVGVAWSPEQVSKLVELRDQSD
jgi:hypothetical protein